MPKARALAFFLIVVSAAAEGVTVDDLMKLSTIVDLDVSPDGNRVVYAVSTPSLERNAHEATIWIATATGRPTRVAEGVKVFAPRLPVPRLRWSPDGARVSLLGLAGEKPQVFAVDLAGGEARRLTSAPEGVTAYEWMPDGRGIVYLMRDPPSEDEQRRRKAGTFVIHADAPEPATRLWRQAPDGSPAVALTPADQYVDAFSVSPDGSRIAYSAAPTSGFPAQYRTRIRIVAAAGGPARLVVDRPGMNTSPRFSPDGSSIAFITSNGRAELMAPRADRRRRRPRDSAAP